MTVPAGDVKAHFSHTRISNSDEVTIVRVRGCEITQADHGDGWAYLRLEDCGKETRLIYKFEPKVTR